MMEVVENIIIHKYDRGEVEILEDIVIKEYPFTIMLNGQEFITLLCSPQGLEYLTVGFLLSEGLIKKKDDILSIKIDEERGSGEVITKKKKVLAKELFEKRTMTTGCGKGTIFYNVIDSFNCKIIENNMKIKVEDIIALMRKFNKMSELFANTGGVHSACISNEKEIILFHEDAGRHNALDKIMGEALVKDIDLKDKMMITSGRISSEMLIKCAKREIPIVISRSAPTDLALKLAKQLGITIVGFARGLRMNIYTEVERVII